MRQLRFHEKRLLKKVNFFNWKTDQSLRETQVLRRYLVQRREDYAAYNRVAGTIKKLTKKISDLDARDPFRQRMADQLLERLYNMGLIATKSSLTAADRITASAFCRRRLPVVLVRLKFAETLKEAVTFVEQGHVRVGPETITDPAFLVTRTMEDFITWTNQSKMKRIVMRYNNALDDYDLLA